MMPPTNLDFGGLVAPGSRLVSIGKLARILHENESVIRHLANQGLLTSVRTPGGHRRFDIGIAQGEFARHQELRTGSGEDTGQFRRGPETQAPSPSFQRTHVREGLDEHAVWLEVQPHLVLPLDNVRRIAQYCVSEMVNNAIDHSNGSEVRVFVWNLAGRARVLVEDDGVGVFDRVKSGWNLPDFRAAAAELTKGKRTTAPQLHTGEGIFFTSKAATVFILESNGQAWWVDNDRADFAIGPSSVVVGTRVTMEFDLAGHLTLLDLFRRFTDDGKFDRSRPVVRLFQAGNEFVSRSEAKRLLTGMHEFSDVDVDFDGVEFVGQAFVDEMFRVWPAEAAGTAIHPINMSPDVEFMVERGRPAASSSNS